MPQHTRNGAILVPPRSLPRPRPSFEKADFYYVCTLASAPPQHRYRISKMAADGVARHSHRSHRVTRPLRAVGNPLQAPRVATVGPTPSVGRFPEAKTTNAGILYSATWRLYETHPQTLGTTNSSWHRLSDGQHLPFPTMLWKMFGPTLASNPRTFDFVECLNLIACGFRTAPSTSHPDLSGSSRSQPNSTSGGPGRTADAVTSAEATTPALPPQNLWVGTGSRPVCEAHVDSNEISDNHGGMPALFACCDNTDPHVALAMITVVGEDASNLERSLHRCIWCKDPEVDPNAGVATALCDAPDDGAFVEHLACRLVTADASSNHGTSQKSNVWKKTTRCLKMPRSAAATWKTAVAEMAARDDPDRDAEPSDLLTEHVSRAKAARQARKNPRTDDDDAVASSSAWTATEL